MDESYGVQSANINSLWLQNIYENIKKLEEHERIAREGCDNLMEYLGIPADKRDLILGDTQYKNIKFMVTELHLLLGDLTPILDETKVKGYKENLNKIEEVISYRKYFVKEPYSSTRGIIISSKPTPFFFETLRFLSDMKIEIIKDIKHILYIKDQPNYGF